MLDDNTLYFPQQSIKCLGCTTEQDPTNQLNVICDEYGNEGYNSCLCATTWAPTMCMHYGDDHAGPEEPPDIHGVGYLGY